MKIIIVLGTRPEVIKLAPVILALRDRAEVRICASGQHREMLVQALEAFSLVPDIQLDTMLSYFVLKRKKTIFANIWI